MRRILAAILTVAFLILPVRAAEEKQYVALTFDDGPSGKYTRALLDGLYDRGVHATFLLCGYRMKDYPDITQRIFSEGHEIGYHGFSHDTMRTMSRRQIAQEILDSRTLIPEDCDPVFLRPPGGFITDAIRQVAQARNLSILSWSVDPKDWATNDKLAIERAVLKNIQDGDIVLLHDMTDSSVQAALDIIDVLMEKDFRIVSVEELIQLRRVKLKPGQVYTCFPKKEENVK